MRAKGMVSELRPLMQQRIAERRGSRAERGCFASVLLAATTASGRRLFALLTIAAQSLRHARRLGLADDAQLAAFARRRVADHAQLLLKPREFLGEDGDQVLDVPHDLLARRDLEHGERDPRPATLGD